MSVRASALLLGALAACTVGAPPGFSSGESWAFPLVGPLEDGALLVPVKLDGKGPYLFLIDPDAPFTSIDEGVAKALDLYGRPGPRLASENGKTFPTRGAELPSLQLGNLTVRRMRVLVHDGGVYHVAGRDVIGVLGRDVIAESLVFTFDRDAGMAHLATREVFAAPESAIRLKYQDVETRNGLINTGGTTRRVVRAQINGTAQSMHLDLGAFQSQLRAGHWGDTHLTPLPYRATLVDEVAVGRAVDKAGIANQVAVGDAAAMGVLMVPYADDRVDAADIDGSLGLNFFARYAVWADWSGHALYLKPRTTEDGQLMTRLARWQSPELAACKQPACVTAMRVPTGGADGPAPPPPPPSADDGEVPELPVELEIQRAASARELIYEVTLEAVDADGQPLGLPRLIATLPRGVTTVRQKISPMFSAARFRVVDVSPFVRGCRQPGGCIFELALAR